MTQVHNNHKVSGETILTLSTWLFAFWGVMIITSFLVRDFSQGTLQLYLNSFKNRAKYFIFQLVYILIASVIVFLTLYVFVLIMQNIGDGKPIKNGVVGKALGIYILLFLFYGLFLITLLVKSSSLIFSICVFFILIIPIATNLFPLIPEYGDEVRKVLKYIPFNFLINNVWLGSLKLNGWQTFISIASVILLAIIDFFTISKKDY